MPLQPGQRLPGTVSLMAYTTRPGRGAGGADLGDQPARVPGLGWRTRTAPTALRRRIGATPDRGGTAVERDRTAPRAHSGSVPGLGHARRPDRGHVLADGALAPLVAPVVWACWPSPARRAAPVARGAHLPRAGCGDHRSRVVRPVPAGKRPARLVVARAAEHIRLRCIRTGRCRHPAGPGRGQFQRGELRDMIQATASGKVWVKRVASRPSPDGRGLPGPGLDEAPADTHARCTPSCAFAARWRTDDLGGYGCSRAMPTWRAAGDPPPSRPRCRTWCQGGFTGRRRYLDPRTHAYRAALQPLLSRGAVADAGAGGAGFRARALAPCWRGWWRPCAVSSARCSPMRAGHSMTWIGPRSSS